MKMIDPEDEETNRPAAGDRLEDGGVMGTLVACEKCGGTGLLHQPDDPPGTPAPAFAHEMMSSVIARVAEVDEFPPPSSAYSSGISYEDGEVVLEKHVSEWRAIRESGLGIIFMCIRQWSDGEPCQEYRYSLLGITPDLYWHQHVTIKK